MAAPNNDNANKGVQAGDGEGKVIILSGASRGIGQAIAHTLLTHSPTTKLVVLSRTHAALDQLLTQYGADRVAVLAGDLADSSLNLATQAVELALSRWGRVDALVVNHGTLDPVGKIADADLGMWRKGLEVNVFSAVELVSLFSFFLPFLFYFVLFAWDLGGWGGKLGRWLHGGLWVFWVDPPSLC